MSTAVYDSASKERAREVAKQVVVAQRMYAAFLYKDEHRPSRAVHLAMLEAESALYDEHYDRAEHLSKVLVCMMQRELPIFLADPKKWVETREELRT